ncbi:rho guanine nucleotide exchange factor 17 isoform X2 [Coregonus clupeaformis]|uniref:rho guanine nucleotide exchange factor 17 isoform X2 n=1 Tax=Coregonus clupeaformis TaxID=59861 RepID=UPI001E1C643F|nr:rho guanine nucleotide exchange factor 17 isoform X2 [Coregonus clupeaformis]
MAEKEKEYRSVSFKKSEGCSASKSRCEDQQNKSTDLEGSSGALPPPSTAAAEKAQPSALRNVSVSRKVSKISAASHPTAELKKGSTTPLSSISPSIRQLTEKFSSTNLSRTHGAPSPGSNVAGKSTTLPPVKSSRGEGSPSLKSFHEDRGYLQVTDTVLTESQTDTKVQEQKFYSGTDSVSGSDSERNQKWIYTRKSAQGSVGAGKRDYSQIDPSVSYNNNCSKTSNAADYVFVSGAPACKSHRSYFPTHHGDPLIHVDLTYWPSVTKIRELFDAEDLKSADHLQHSASSKENSLSDRSDRQSPNSPAPEATSLSLSDRHRSRAAFLGRERRHQGIDSAFHPDQHYSDEAEIESASTSISRSGRFLRVAQPSNTHRAHSPSSGGEGPETWTSSLNSDSPASVLASAPAPPPQSNSVGLSSSRVRPSEEQRQSQGAGQPRDSLHSSHSFSRPVAPSSDRASTRAAITARWRFSSGDEEEYHRSGGRSAPSLGVSRGYLCRGKNGWWGGKVLGRSSGSEEDSPASLGPSRDTVRRRSLRKKKKKNSEVAVATGRDDGESDDSDDEQTGMMEHLERHQQNTGATAEQSGRSRNRLREPEGSRTCVAQWGRNSTPNQMGAQESYRRQYTSGEAGTSHMTTPLPGVSRVSKVNISSFISSPGGSQSSSRYCSTETLKEEDQASYINRRANSNTTSTTTTTNTPGSVVGASSSMLSKTYHGNFTMYRSPSFGHGDNFSHAPVRVRPRILSPVNPPATGDTGGVAREETTVFRRLLSGGVVGDKDRNRMSMSNPDIASETMSLLSFLKSDLSDLRVRKTDRSGSGVTEGSSTVYRMGSRGLYPGLRPSLKDLTATLRRAKSFTYSDKPVGRQHPAGSSAKRSTSEQRLDQEEGRDGGRGAVPDREVESDREDCRAGGYEDVMPTLLQDRYVQEARQVIRDICQMSAREDEDDDDDDVLATDGTEDEGFKRKEVEEQEIKESEGGELKNEERRAREEVDIGAASSVSEEKEKSERECENRERQKGDSEENVFCDRSVDELSGHESSLTDEGIVTEPETGLGDPERLFVGSSLGSSLARDVLGQPLTTWKQSALHEEEWPGLNEGMREGSGLHAGAREKRENPVSVPALGVESEGVAVVTEMSGINNNSISGRANVSQSASVPGLEAPPTPSAIRRRRKFSLAGNTGSDSSNGSNGESNGNGDPTVYRSLSDPMPHRRRSVSEEGNNSFSVDSNLLGSLSLSYKGAGGVGGGSVPESSSAADLSECSAASDLSVCSDCGLRDDYSNVIRSIVAAPGAMDRLMTDDKNNGKATKKKSFSDPSRRGEGPLLDEPGFKSNHHPKEPISELDQPGQIPPSSSEPILSEQRDELCELGDERGRPLRSRHGNNEGGKFRSQSERELHSCLRGDDCYVPNDTDGGGGGEILDFDPKLAEVRSPRMGRRTSRKRPNWVTQSASEEPDHSEPGPEDQGPEEDQDQDQSALTPPLPLATPIPKTRPKHVRHASEPATFIPISPQPQRAQGDLPALLPASEPSIPGGESEPSGSGSESGSGGTVHVPDVSNSSPATPTGAREPRLQRKSSEELTTPAPPRAKPRVDMRRHVMMTLLDTEQSYVESLRTLIQGYMRPLKHSDSGSLVDPSLVDEMFYQIPEILEHHEHFLEQVTGCISQWHDRQTVGQLLIQSFSKEILANIYSAYIDNFLNAKDAVRIAKEAKPAFLKFLETSMRENKEKQALGDLMIKPVQRIPRYELLVKDLLKHTPEEHPDHPLLLDAQRDIKRLAEKINKGRRSAEEVERETRVMQEIEAHIEGVEHVRDILNPMRKFLRQEMVMEAKTVGGKKDRSLFLFSDLLICTTLKRKSGSLRRSSMSLYSAASVIDTSSKYKFLWKLPLEDVEMVKSPSQATNKETIHKMIGRLDEDLSTLGQISKLSETLSFPHQSLDEAIKDLMASVHRELAEKQSLAFSMTFLPTKLELTTASAETSFVFEFSSPDTRSNFQQAFEDAKKKLAMNKDQWDPEFLKAIPIMKTRSGMQFSCASPSHSCPESSSEVWVCNSDGYVGQVCLLNIRDQPTVEACIAVCSARIICIAAVPGLKGRERGVEPSPALPPGAVDSTPSQQQQLHISISHSSLELTEPPSGAGPELVPFDSDDTDDEDSPSPSSTLQSQASHSTVSSSYGNEEGSGSKDMATEITSSEEEQEYPVASPYGAPGRRGGGGRGRPHSESPMDGRAMRRSSRGSFTRASLEDLLSIDPEAYQSSVWLGTEDGCIHVYQSSDNIRNRKNSMKMQHSASILCILYLDNKVFVSLANGEVIVYQREVGSFWDAQSSQTLSLGTPSSPVTKMVPIGGKLWCGSQNRVLIINTTTLVQEHWFQVGTDSSRCVTCMVSYGQGVWLALQGSAQIRLYHAQTWDSLTEVDVAPAVHKMLAGSDAIIRQHKAACLRITALLACKDLLWIGTSAGVVLTLSIPAISSGTVSGTLRSPLTPMGSAHGHTGHVRFLTSIELPEGFDVNFPLPADTTGNPAQSGVEGGNGGLQRRDSARRRASALLPVKTNQLVISGGDGYEDFRLTNSSETVGRDDSTNHLLLWRV